MHRQKISTNYASYQLSREIENADHSHVDLLITVRHFAQ